MPSQRRAHGQSSTTTVALVGACVLGLLGWRLGGVPTGSAPIPVSPVVDEARIPESVVVHVAGLVAHPGLVTLPAGSRIAEAIAAAGGLLDRAEVTVNLAAVVVDGQQIVVGPGVAPGASAGGAQVLSLNTSTASELETLPGVGPVLAARIVAYREEHGPFDAVEDLLSITGIGERMLATLRDLVAVP